MPWLTAMVRISKDHHARVGEVIDHPVGKHAHACTSHHGQFIPTREHWGGIRPIKYTLDRGVDRVIEVVTKIQLLIVVLERSFT